MNKIIFTISLLLFLIACVIHLIFCFFEKEKARRFSKPFALPFLAIAISSIVPDRPLIWLFPIFSWIGDILLIWRRYKKRFFVAGTISFIIGHFCILAQMILLLIESGHNFPLVIYFTFAILIFAIISLLYPITKKKAGKIALLGSIYMPILVFLTLFSVILIGSIPDSYIIILTFFGYILFVFSDAFLIFTSFIGDVKRRDFFIMLTYFVAEVLICIGLTFFIIL